MIERRCGYAVEKIEGEGEERTAKNILGAMTRDTAAEAAATAPPAYSLDTRLIQKRDVCHIQSYTVDGKREKGKYAERNKERERMCTGNRGIFVGTERDGLGE